jgi:hypothetical protein
MAVFWYVAPSGQVDTDCHFKGAYSFHHKSYGDIKLLWNIGKPLPDYTEDINVHTFCHENFKSHCFSIKIYKLCNVTCYAYDMIT